MKIGVADRNIVAKIYFIVVVCQPFLYLICYPVYKPAQNPL